ncbi:hypothetical protein CHS0354_020361 [Potamilus streckersoni]|uniref:Uncharacterized protein n=1 Tax=Potamilus streckersoni TaxID=2493646 RepID=A0AAE0SG01_9BIVA|nr:hypothetical protein CHS0354_020361 [Potamilus streckersoni]
MLESNMKITASKGLNILICLVVVMVQPGLSAPVADFLLLPSEQVVAIEEANACPNVKSISEEDVKTFNESYTNMLHTAMDMNPSLQNFIKSVEMAEVTPSDSHTGFFSNVCPSVTKTALYWGVPYQNGYQCWIIQPVYFTKCLTYSCQTWNGVPWIPNYRFRCHEKYTYELVWSFCVHGRKTKFVLIRVQVPKCCVCALSKC